ncbi:MAG: hypothetical protein WEB06_19995 [Actinomycetota bacterium]
METDVRETLRKRAQDPHIPTDIPDRVLDAARRRMMATGLLTAVMIAGLGVGAAVGFRAIGRVPDGPAEPVVRPAQGRPAVIALGETKTGSGLALTIAADPAGVWVNLADEVVRVDPRTNKVTTRIPGPGFTGGIAVGFGSLWIADDAAVTRRDLHSGQERVRITLNPRRTGEGRRAIEIAAGEGAVWVAAGTGSGFAIDRIDPATDEVAATIDVESFLSMTVGEDALWVFGRDNVVRIDAATNRTTTWPRGEARLPAAAGGGYLWAPDGEPRLGQVSRILRIDPASGRVSHEIDVAYAGPVVAGEGAIWALDLQWPSGILKIDPSTARVVQKVSLDLGRGPPSLHVGAGSIWVTRHEGSEQSTVTLLRFLLS